LTYTDKNTNLAQPQQFANGAGVVAGQLVDQLVGAQPAENVAKFVQALGAKGTGDLVLVLKTSLNCPKWSRHKRLTQLKRKGINEQAGTWNPWIGFLWTCQLCACSKGLWKVPLLLVTFEKRNLST